MIEFSNTDDGYILNNFLFPFEGFQRDEFIQDLLKTNPSLVEIIDFYDNNKGNRVYLNFNAVTAYLKHNKLVGISVELNDGTFKRLS